MYEEHNCKGCSNVFKILTSLVLLELIFLVSVSYVYLKEYYSNVKPTYNETNRTYTIGSEFVALYLTTSYSTLIFVVYVIYFISMLCCMYMCQ